MVSYKKLSLSLILTPLSKITHGRGFCSRFFFTMTVLEGDPLPAVAVVVVVAVAVVDDFLALAVERFLFDEATGIEAFLGH